MRAMAIAVVMTATLLCGAGAARADASLRCGNQFIRIGDSQFQVREACGEPKFRDVVSGEEAPKVEQWVYESGWSRFDRMLTFVGGRLEKIERLDD